MTADEIIAVFNERAAKANVLASWPNVRDDNVFMIVTRGQRDGDKVFCACMTARAGEDYPANRLNEIADHAIRVLDNAA